MALKITEAEARYARLLVVDRLPAGLEIDNPALFDSGSIDALSWLKRDLDPVYAEYRDDRFVAAFNREPGQSAFLYDRLCRARNSAGTLCLSAGDRGRHVSPRTLRPHRVQRSRGEGEVNETRARIEGGGRKEEGWGRSEFERRLVGALGVLCFRAWLIVPAAWNPDVQNLGALDLKSSREGSTIVVDREGRLLRAFTLPDGRWRLPERPARSIRAISRCCSPMRTVASSAIPASTGRHWRARRGNGRPGFTSSPAARRSRCRSPASSSRATNAQ